MLNVKIVYCQRCSFMSRAIELANQLLFAYGLPLNKRLSVALEASDGGIFEVYVDGKLAFSNQETKRLPGFEEIKRAVDRAAGESG